MKQTKDYRVEGVIIFIEPGDAIKFGFVDDITPHPVLTYKTGTDNDNLYIKNDLYKDTYKVIPDHLIKEFLTIEEARVKYPEVFL